MSELLHISTTLAKIIARINPKIWEVIGGGPLGKKYQHAAQFAEPEPAPWLEAAQLAAVSLAQRQVDAAATILTQGGDTKGFLKAILDDWCGTVPRPPLNWPGHGPRPPRPPRPDELEDYTLPMAGGLAFVALSEAIGNEAFAGQIAELGGTIIDRTATYALEHTAKRR
ncbi:hypothetical protein [Duganella sp. Root1480D1]|uniref:hypothetical protein n=1 Tax=Duganella sp. Root1480D1 TaxID=1736471 RepID=UPI00070C7A1D|nr:hypothetical protein [Duganella sp. Root1480D1]KQZ28112.1 hypothetical protein ASD58_11765 [Duganella sp. Root1480D1]